MSLETAAPLFIEPPGDLLQKAPHLRHLSRQLSLKFVHREVVTDDDLRKMGQSLWQTLDMEGAFEKAFAAAKPSILPVAIISDVPENFGLPWETLYHPEIGFLGKDTRFTLTRRIKNKTTANTNLEKGPLRVLLFTSLPDNFEERGRLDTESERENVLEALTPWVQEGWVSLEAPDDGRFGAFQKLIAQGDFHLVFLSGHGEFKEDKIFEKPARSYFLFEGDNGFADPREAEEIASCFAGQRSTRAVVLAACHSGRTASDNLSAGLAMALIDYGIPMVVGMRESIFDQAGIVFSRAFFDAVGNRVKFDVALQQARNNLAGSFKVAVLKKEGHEGSIPELNLGQWCLPAFYTLYEDNRLIDWNFTPQSPAKGIQLFESYAGVEFPRRFIGRRCELRTLLEKVSKGIVRMLVLTGAGGMGKTALACRMAKVLEEKGYLVLTYPAREETPWNTFITNLHLALDDQMAEKVNQAWGRLTDRKDQYGLLIKTLLSQTGGRVVFLLDNLESVQDQESRRITDPELDMWLKACLDMGKNAPLTLITSRWQIPGLDGKNILNHPLERAGYGDFLRYTQEILTEKLKRDTLRRLHQDLGGNFKGLQFFAQAISLGSDEKALLDRIAQARDELKLYMALDALAAGLTPDSQTLLSRMRAYDSPVLEDGVFMLAQDLPHPDKLLKELTAYSLLDVSVDMDLSWPFYSLNPVTAQWLESVHEPLDLQVLKKAAKYQIWVLEQLQPTINQVIVTHQSLLKSGQNEKGHQFVLDHLVDYFLQKGFYQGLQTTWLPPLLESSSDKIRGDALNYYGVCCFHTGKFDTALDYLKQSLAIQREIGDRAGEGTTLNNISQIYDARGDYDTALDYLKQSLAIQREIGDRALEGTNLNNIALIYHARGYCDTALDYLGQSLSIQREIGDRAGMCVTLFNMGHIHLRNKEFQKATVALLSAYANSKKIQYSEALEQLDALARQMGQNGLDFWEKLLKISDRNTGG